MAQKISSVQFNNPYPGGSAIPTVYDIRWNTYTDLSPAQVAAFEAFPQDLTAYTGSIRLYYEMRAFPMNNPLYTGCAPTITVNGVPIAPSTDNLTKITALALDAQLNNADTYSFTVAGTVYNLNSTQAIALFNGVRAYVQQCRNIEATMITGINAMPPIITARSQIDAAFAVLN